MGCLGDLTFIFEAIIVAGILLLTLILFGFANLLKQPRVKTIFGRISIFLFLCIIFLFVANWIHNRNFDACTFYYPTGYLEGMYLTIIAVSGAVLYILIKLDKKKKD